MLEPEQGIEGRASKEPIFVKEGRYYAIETNEHEVVLVEGSMRLDKRAGEKVSVSKTSEGRTVVSSLEPQKKKGPSL